MKKLVLLTLVFISTLTSCSVESEEPVTFHLQVLPIESVNVPEHFVQGESYEISVTYSKPNPCYYFNDFIYEIDGHERTVAVVNTVYANGSCNGTPEDVTVSFDFTASGTETYLFKFFQGEDAQGVDQYYLVEVPVVDGRLNSGKN